RARRQARGARGRHAGRGAAIRARLPLARAAPTRRPAARRRADRLGRARLRDSVAHAAAARRERDQARGGAARAGRDGRACGDGSLVLEVRDDGPGAKKPEVDAAVGMGLRAVRQRLETRYGKEASFSITTAPREGFIVRASIPAHVGTVLTPAPAVVSSREGT